jgi:hypothetical protein
MDSGVRKKTALIEIKQMHKQIRGKEHNNIIEMPVTIEAKKEINILNLNDALAIKKEQGMLKNGSDELWFKLQVQAILDNKPSLIGPFNGIENAWKGEPCYVVGSSRGLASAMQDGFTFDRLHGQHSIGINHIIEDYHYFEWFLFLDGRFLKLSKYDVIGHYKGRVFATRRSGLTPSDKITIFYKTKEAPTEQIINGLYDGQVSGVCALHLAIISGANPIYMLGMDNGGIKSNKDGNHFKKDYTGESLKTKGWENYLEKIPRFFDRFEKWKDRIINVDPLGDIKTFRKVSWKDVE